MTKTTKRREKPKPDKPRKPLVSEVLFCDECITGGGFHRAGCTKRKKIK
jgi:hypothetical protein